MFLKLFCFGILFFFSQLSALAPEIQEIVDRGVLKIAMLKRDEFPFFMVSKEGKLVGSDIDLAHQIAKELGVAVEFDRVYPSYNAIVDGVSQGKADIALSFISKTLSRSKLVFFTTPYISLHLGLALNRKQIAEGEAKDISVITYIKEKKFKVGTLENSAYIPLTQSLFPENEVVPMVSGDVGFEAVKNGEIVAFLTYELDIDRFIVNSPQKSLQVKTILFRDLFDHVSIAVPPTKPQLLYFLNTFLEMTPSKFTVEKLFKHYQHFTEEKDRINVENHP